MKTILHAIALALALNAPLWVKPLLIAQGPSQTPLITSNLTINYVLSTMIVGILPVWLVRRRITSIHNTLLRNIVSASAIVVFGSLYLVLLKLLGVEMKW